MYKHILVSTFSTLMCFHRLKQLKFDWIQYTRDFKYYNEIVLSINKVLSFYYKIKFLEHEYIISYWYVPQRSLFIPNSTVCYL